MTIKSPTATRGALQALTRRTIAAPQRTIALALIVLAGIIVFGIPVMHSLSAGGVRNPASESSQAAQLLSDKFNQGNMAMIVSVTSAGGVYSPASRSVGTDIVSQLHNSPNVGQVLSAWTAPAAPSLISKDGKTGLIIAGICGNDTDSQQRAKELATKLIYDRDGVTVRLGGEATIYWQINAQMAKDLLIMESLAMPLTFLVLVWVFGGLIAAGVALAIGGYTILGSMAALHAITLFTDVSIFALNLCTALSIALAVDYTLLILSRYRSELATGATPHQALRHTMATAGRTVLFSAITVASSMATMVLFPQYFLKSFAYGGVATVAFAAATSLIVTPAAIALLGDRLDALDIRTLRRRVPRPPDPQPKPIEHTFWYRTTTFAMRHALPIGAAIIALLLLLGLPFLNVKWGFPDDRMLPASASARQVGEQLRNDFTIDPANNITVVMPDAHGVTIADLGHYAARLSTVSAVSSVSSPMGTFINGHLSAPPTAPTAITDGSAYLTITSTAPLFSNTSRHQLDQLHAITTPANKTIQLAGLAQSNHDSVHAVTSRLPLVLGIIAALTLILVFLFTGSLVLPIKAVLLNILSLTAAFGAMVWVFQQGHLDALGTPITGTLEVDIPVMLFCIAFGLSMDYEMFLLSRIREYWLNSDRTPAANNESVARGLAHTGRVITAAALIMAISFAALMAAQVSFIRMFGLGLTIAVLADATLVRMLLVPAFMRILGKRNWWAPRPLAKLHQRLGLNETATQHRDQTPAPPSPAWAGD